MSKVYRIRKGLFGKSVLQKRVTHKIHTGGGYWEDSEPYWIDVPYKEAPPLVYDNGELNDNQHIHFS